MPQPLPVSAKPETQATLATKKAEPQATPTKAEPTPVATKSQPSPAAVKKVPTVPTPKEKMDPTSVKMDTMAKAATAQIEPTTEKVSPGAAENASTAEPPIPTLTPVQEMVVTPKVEVLNTDIPKTVTVGDKEGLAKVEDSTKESYKTEESKSDISKIKAEAGVAVASSLQVTEATVVPTSTIAAEDAMSGIIPATETQPELSAPERIVKEVHPDDHIKLAVEVKSKSQEQLPVEAEPAIAADRKEVADKLAEEKIATTSIQETQPVSTNIIIKVRVGPFD